ncbi:MAG: Crp/Fnr family transcriptional regulator [Cyclobacteriaceae bacterium]|nr:MAG: Crp/Fnr family transcriptional regulator [Cyclobacteriaceae bacterium]
MVAIPCRFDSGPGYEAGKCAGLRTNRKVNLRQLFPRFDDELLAYLEKVASEISFEEGEVVMRPGQYFKSAIIITDGRVKVYREGADAEEFFLYYLESGHACALSMICAAKNEESQVKAVAVTPVKALVIPLPHLDVLMRNYPNWYYFVLESYRNRFEELLSVIDQVAFHSMDEKLVHYLRRQFQTLGPVIQVTHQQIADDLNSSREVISRLIKKLEQENKIATGRSEIRNIAI